MKRKTVNYKGLYERERRRANVLMCHMLEMRSAAEHVSELSRELQSSIGRDSMGICLPPYVKLATVAVHQAASAAFMTSLRQADPEIKRE